MLKFKTLLIALIMMPIVVFSQEKFTISGNISDESNGEILIGASAYIEILGIGTVTNLYGFYSVTVPKGIHNFEYSYIGYDKMFKTLDVNENIKLDIELSEASLDLGEIVVIAEEKKTDTKTPQMSVTKISAARIKQIPAVFGEVDIIKSIQLLPGVTNGGEGSGGFNVRGGAADQNLILFDEAILFSTSHLFGFFSVFNADAINDIKLYKGGIPSKYGGRISSVLDVRQKDGNKKGFHANGGIGIISSRLMVEGPIDHGKGSFLLAGRTSYVNLFLKLRNEETRVGFYDLNTKVSYKFSNTNKVFVSGYFGKDNMTFNKNFGLDYGNSSGNIRWNHLFSDKLFSNLSLIYSRFDYSLNIDIANFVWNSYIKNYNLKYDFNYFANEKFSLNYGINVIRYKFNPGEVIPESISDLSAFELEQKNAFESAAYLDIEHNVSKKLTLRYGLRYSSFLRMGGQELNKYADQPINYLEAFDIYQAALPIGTETYKSNEIISDFGGFEPRFSASYQINKNNSIKASYQHMIQYLHLISNTNSPAPLDVWTPSGPFVEPQSSDQYALGFFNNFHDNDYSIEVEGYYKDLKNRLDYIDGSNIIAQNHIETEVLSGIGRAYGLEVLLRKNEGKLTGWIAYTLSKSEQKVVGINENEPGINNGDWYNTAYDRTHDISITASYEINPKWRLGANFIYQTGRPTNYPSGNYTYGEFTVPVYVSRNVERLPAYHRLDLSATYSKNPDSKKRLKSEWSFGIYNVYNRKNAASIDFRQNEDTNKNEAVKTSIFPFMPAVTYNFKF